MGVIQLPDELQRAIEQQVAAGRAASPAAFVAEAVQRMLDDDPSDPLYDVELETVIEAGLADIEAGRYVTISSREESRELFESIFDDAMARVAREG